MPANATQVHRSAIFLTISRSGPVKSSSKFSYSFCLIKPTMEAQF